MATELVQVLLQIETQLQQLSHDSISMASNSNSTNDDLKCSRDDQWMQLYLSACKLLETLCTLPSGYVSQFQTCHWAFISSLVTNSTTDPFVPFAVRIHQLLCDKYGSLSIEEQNLHSASLQHVKTLTSFSELRPFFHALASQHTTVVAGLTGNTIQQECFLHDASSINGSMTLRSAISRLEHSLYVDFAEHLQL
uniref:DOP1-like C-terminal domain-containing protein n=1 Tax=Panagrolaimus superbus TaxID=310955 RepID=A0A914YVI2_9BILA